jgi:hypothetical protein
MCRKSAGRRYIQLPICSIEPRWLQPIAAQQVLDDHAKPNEAACASIRSDTTIRTLSFFELCHQSAKAGAIKAGKQARLCYLARPMGKGVDYDDPCGSFARVGKYGTPAY